MKDGPAQRPGNDDRDCPAVAAGLATKRPPSTVGLYPNRRQAYAYAYLGALQHSSLSLSE
jgi:hypothetical protein